MQPENALGVQSPPSNRWASLYPELIYKVFTYCLSGATLDVCSPELFPWHLGHACTSWRSVFVFSPRFWDRFTFEVLELGRVTIDHLERALTLVKLCVKRTQDQPFSFRFNARVWTRGATAQSLCSAQIMEILVAHADRWSAAYIAAERLDGLEELLLKAKHRFGRLHTLQISIPFGTSYHLNHPDLFEDAPNLIRVYTIDYHRLRWSSITVLHIEFICRSTDRLFAELNKMTCLEELVIKGSPQQNEVDLVVATPVEIPSLKTFYVDHYYPISVIRAPSLERLYLNRSSLNPYLGNSPIPIFENFLHRVVHLKTLSLDPPSSSIARVIDWTPELEHVIITGKLLALNIVKSLVHRTTAHSLKKMTVVITIYKGYPALLRGIMEMVESWEKHQFPNLHLLSVHVQSNEEDDMSPAVVDLVQLGARKGFEVDVKLSQPPQIMPLFGDF